MSSSSESLSLSDSGAGFLTGAVLRVTLPGLVGGVLDLLSLSEEGGEGRGGGGFLVFPGRWEEKMVSSQGGSFQRLELLTFLRDKCS